MPTTLVNRVSLDRVQDRKTGLRDLERAPSAWAQGLVFAAVCLATFAICVFCLAYGVRPIPVNASEIAALLAP